MKKDIASKIEELKAKKTKIDPKSLGLGAYEPKNEQEDTADIESCMNEFAAAWGAHEDNVQRAADALWSAVCIAGEKEAFEKFDLRFHLGEYNLKLLADIGAQQVDSRVFSLPRYMHGIRNMDLMAQFGVFNTGCISIYKFASEKPVTIGIGNVNQSDWRVAWDRERNRLRTSKEQLEYIHAKKASFADKMRWVKFRKDAVVFLHGGSWMKEELQDILKKLDGRA